MRFEFAIAAKYLVPRFKQLSTSIISLLSVLVISLVVWLILVFMSVTDGLEKMWIDKLIALNAPLRLTPTEEYYRSYYHKIDAFSEESHFRSKSLWEKSLSTLTDPYIEGIDPELPETFPASEQKDIVKETFQAIQNMDVQGLTTEPFEAALATVKLGGIQSTTYIASLPGKNPRFSHILTKPTAADMHHLALQMPKEEQEAFLKGFVVKELTTAESGFEMPKEWLKQETRLDALAVTHDGKVSRILIAPEPEKLLEQLKQFHYPVERGIFQGSPEKFSFNGEEISLSVPLMLAQGFAFEAKNSPFHIQGKVQNLWVDADVGLSEGLLFSKVEQKKMKELTLPEGGVVVPRSFRENGILLGDKGELAFQAMVSGGVQEMHLPIVVAGFYDPGIMSVGGRLLFVQPHVASLVRSSSGAAEQPLGNGIHVWFDDLSKTSLAKKTLLEELQRRGLDPYWQLETYQEYDFAKDLVQQLRSDKNLFSLLAIIIITVACSNIISMLILLVNDKKKEIGILQSMGASSKSIALIFGTCGVVMGLLSSLIGTAAAYFTLAHLQGLANFLSHLQGFDAFNAMFYGDTLPSEMSSSALTMVWAATSLISLLAGLIPAIKASLIRPAAILRAE